MHLKGATLLLNGSWQFLANLEGMQSRRGAAVAGGQTSARPRVSHFPTDAGRRRTQYAVSIGK